MKTLHVSLPDRDYDIIIGNGTLSQLGEVTKRFCKGPSVVVTDTHVWSHYGERASALLAEAGIDFDTILLSPGEGTKSVSMLEHLWQFFAGQNMTRGSVCVALGGGVIGDLSGLAAATYMRGIPVIQIPTTLLSQVDSSVGGKTAINLPQGKNLVGAFHQPSAVLIDPTLLSTLPQREYRGGMAEVIKYGAIRSSSLLAKLAEQPEDLTEIIYTCCDIKRSVVENDERESGERMLLNFGHTFGHALEKHLNYDYTHGEAVAIGMALAAQLGEAAGITKPGTADELSLLLKSYGLNTACPISPLDLIAAIRRDKKAKDGGVQMVLLHSLGESLVMPMTIEEIENLLRKEAIQ